MMYVNTVLSVLPVLSHCTVYKSIWHFFANNMIPIGSHKKVLNEYIMYVQYIVCTFTK